MSAKNVYGYSDDGTPLTTQRAVVRDYLKTHRGITQNECSANWGFTRLSAIIYDIKEDLKQENSDYCIWKKDETGVSRYGIGTHWAEYRLILKTDVPKV